MVRAWEPASGDAWVKDDSSVVVGCRWRLVAPKLTGRPRRCEARSLDSAPPDGKIAAMSPLTLTGLHVYPIKSAGGIAVPSWPVDEFGLRYDRRWMVVDQSGEAVTQREYPRLALVRTAIEGDRLRVSAPGCAPLDLPLAPS